MQPRLEDTLRGQQVWGGDTSATGLMSQKGDGQSCYAKSECRSRLSSRRAYGSVDGMMLDANGQNQVCCLAPCVLTRIGLHYILFANRIKAGAPMSLSVLKGQHADMGERSGMLGPMREP